MEQDWEPWEEHPSKAIPDLREKLQSGAGLADQSPAELLFIPEWRKIQEARIKNEKQYYIIRRNTGRKNKV